MIAAGFFEEVLEIVQEEPDSAHNPEILGQQASIGIPKGKTFKADTRMQKIPAVAAAVGNAAQRTGKTVELLKGIGVSRNV